MRELARNRVTGYLFPPRNNLRPEDFEIVTVPDSFVGERMDDSGNIISHSSNPRDDTSDAEIIEETPAPAPKKVTKKKVTKKKVTKKVAAKPATVEDDLFDGID